MSITPESQARSPEPAAAGAYYGYSDLVDYILGITFEIWEQRKVDRILDYYGEDIDVFSMEGLTRGSAEMVEQTHATLEAYPDRLLLADDVICSGDLSRGFSSHRIISPMTNRGATAFGPATGRRLVVMNIADCEVRDGRITREWLFRDNLAIASQLGIDSLQAAQALSARMDEPFLQRLDEEFERTYLGMRGSTRTIGASTTDPFAALAAEIVTANWTGEAHDAATNGYAPYAVLQRAPVRIHSGRDEILEHYAAWRSVIPDARVHVDHVCSQPFGPSGRHIAIRWSVAGHQSGALGDVPASGKPVYLVGATHWREVQGRIVAEWTVFDEIALMAQILRRER